MKKNSSHHVKIGDKVKVISGNQKGIIGTIISIIPKNSIVYIEGITPRLKTLKNQKEGQEKTVEIQIPIHISNVMLWDKTGNIASRIGYKVIANEKKRYFKKSGNILEN
jgi:large subunit ribosomal protein L24